MLLSNKNQMKNAFKLSSNLHPLSLPLKGGEVEGVDFFPIKGGEVERAGFFPLKGAEEMNCKYLSPKGGETTSSINLTLSGEEQKRGLFKDHNSKSAFTLVELAIVLVIVGLITVGVVGGQSIIYTANVNSTIAQMRGYNTALNAFKLEFGGIPGDFKEAEEYEIHTDQNGDVNTCVTSTGSGTNGNGDGVLQSRTNPVFRYYGEVGNFFPHLQNAGLINEAMRVETLSCNNTDERQVGDDYPAIDIGTSIIALSNDKKIAYVIGALRESGTSINIQGTVSFANELKPKESSDLDKKLDDGNPARGFIKVLNYYRLNSQNTYALPNNATSCVENSEYNVDYDEQVCTLEIEASRF
jgi:prepilin-type N-terminal cleavage/methylation domain-containing protein